MFDRRIVLIVIAGLTCLGVAAQSSLPHPEVLESRDTKTGDKAIIVATTGPRAIRSGLEAMQAGGTAADAVLTTALAQIVLAAGSWVSYAGRMTFVYYEAETGKVSAMNANYDAPLEEKDPLTIPRQGTPSGRTVLVPGFMAGVQSAHERLGKLPFAELFHPAIRLAEEGFVLRRGLGGLIARRGPVLSRLPATRAVFTKKDGALFGTGDLFRQPALAKTLKAVAEQGAKYMYTGTWAENFVAAVGADGGKLGMKDLARYRVRWEVPLETVFRGHRIVTLPPPNRGGPIAVMALNLAEEADLAKTGHYAGSAASLSKVLRIESGLRVALSPRARPVLEKHLREADFSPAGIWSKATAKELWKAIDSPRWARIIKEARAAPQKGSDHSDSVVAVDRAGNVAAILHTINTGGWGTTGLVVDGVSIPDSAAHQQRSMAAVGPGGRLPDHGPPLIALKDGRPVLACSATGSGNFTATWQNVLNVLEFGMSPAVAAATPNVYQGAVQTRDFDPKILASVRKSGVNVKTVERHSNSNMGYWVGIRIDGKTGLREGGKIGRLDGVVLEEKSASKPR